MSELFTHCKEIKIWNSDGAPLMMESWSWLPSRYS